MAEGASASARWALAGVVLVGILLRFGAVHLVGETPPVGDERGYLRRAEAVASGVPEETLGERPPGYGWWGAAWVAGPGDGARALRIAGIVTGTGIVLLTLWIGRRHAGPAAGLAAAAALALYPEQVLYDTSLWSESLYAALLLAAVALAVRGSEASGRAALAWAAAAGAGFGLAALTREVGLLALAVTAGWLALGDGRRGRAPALAMLGAAALVVLPWSVTQSLRAGVPVVISQTAGQNLFLGNWEDPAAESGPLAGPRKRAKYEALGATQVAREAEARRLALAAIRSRLPAWPFEKIMSEIPDLLAPRSIPSARLAASAEAGGWQERWAYRLPDAWDRPAVRRGLAGVTVAAWILAGAAGVAGLALGTGRLGGLFLALVAGHLVPVILAFGITRFRMPLVPWLLVAGIPLLLAPRSVWRGATPRRRWAAAVAVLLFLGILLSRWRTLETPGFG